jgi:hypothetical protein
MTIDLTQERALIFRITHRDNVPWILKHGLHCPSSNTADPNFVSIGNPDLIDRRRNHAVPVRPYGTLSDYVPFYFTPLSVMMFNIKTGWNGIRQRKNEEIVIIVTSIHVLIKNDVRFLFTDRHAYLQAAQYYSEPTDLCEIDWSILRDHDFKNDPEDPEKKERYQAEALIHAHLPVGALLGIACYDDRTTKSVKERLGSRDMKVITKPGWYF